MKTNLQDELKSKFDQLIENTATDPELKKEVFTTLTRIENMATLIELFTGKMAEAESVFIDGLLKR